MNKLTNPTCSKAVCNSRHHLFDPISDFVKLNAQAPIHSLMYPDGHVGWLVTNRELVCKILTDSRFSARSEFKRSPIKRPSINPYYRAPALPGWMVDMDPPEHRRYRQALSEPFSMKCLNNIKPRLKAIIDQHLEAMSKLEPPVDLIEHFALPIPSLAICEILGVPYEQRRKFQINSAALFSLDVSAEDASHAMTQLTEFLLTLINEKRFNPQDDLLSELIQQKIFSDVELAGLGVLLLSAGHETTASMLGLGTLALLSHPTELKKLTSDSSRTENAIEELLRYLTIFQFGVPRTPLEDVTIDGYLMRAGDSVTLALPTANRDPAKFENPNQLDIDRNTSGHVAFGFGIHYCMGRNLARIEMQIGFSALFKQFPTLRLAMPIDNVETNTNSSFYGIHHLAVTW